MKTTTIAESTIFFKQIKIDFAESIADECLLSHIRFTADSTFNTYACCTFTKKLCIFEYNEKWKNTKRVTAVEKSLYSLYRPHNIRHGGLNRQNRLWRRAWNERTALAFNGFSVQMRKRKRKTVAKMAYMEMAKDEILMFFYNILMTLQDLFKIIL